MNIVWEDNRIILCEKPAGVLSQAGSEGGEDMVTLLGKYRLQKGEPSFIAPVHRLDRGVGGLMVYAKDVKAAGKLSALIQEHDFTKEYRAVIHGVPDPPDGEMTDLLFRDASRNKTFIVKRERKGVREAKLSYRLLGTADRAGETVSLVTVRLYTGRTHQVRVQFASRKMPLLGDGKYGGHDNGIPLALWSSRIAFIHPFTGEHVDVMLSSPDCAPWSLFQDV